MTPGVYLDLSNEDYHKGEGVSKSSLDKADKALAVYHAHYIAEDRPPPLAPTPSMLMGTLAHCAILEPSEFDKRYVTLPPDLDMRTKAGKEWAASVPGGMTVIAEHQKTAAFAMRESLLRLPDIAAALGRGNPEVSGFWIDPVTGLLCKCRPDWVHDCDDGGVVIVDVKTTTDASPREFARSVAKWRYHVQHAWYTDGFALASGRPVHAFIFATVESSYPYLPAAFMLDDESTEYGRRQYRKNLNAISEGFTTRQWPAYGDEIQLLSLPAWAMRD